MTLSVEELDEFCAWHRARVLRRTGKAPAVGTLRTKRSRLRVAADVSGSTGLRALSVITSDRNRVESLLDLLAARMTTGSMQPVVHALRDLADYAMAKGWTEGCALTKEDVPPPNPQKPITVYTTEELALLVNAARGKSLRWWALLSTVAETGRRVGEVLGLEWAWLNLSADVPHFHLPTSKNGRQQYVPLTRTLRQDVFTPENIATLRAEEREGANRQFGRDVRGYPFPWTYACTDKMLRRYCASLGVTCRGFHNFRHTRATELLGKGVPLQAVSALLGHANVATTDRIYNHANALSFSKYLDD